MNTAEVIAWTWAAVMTGAVVGVLSPDLRRRQRGSSSPQESRKVEPPGRISLVRPPSAPERLVQDLQKTSTEDGWGPMVVTVEDAPLAGQGEAILIDSQGLDPIPAVPAKEAADDAAVTVEPEATAVKAKNKAQRRSRKNSSAKRRKRHGRR